MANITAADVKALREKTGAGMMDAKKALTENNGDMEQAVDWLRKKGLSKAAKKSSRTAAEGLVGIAISGNCGVAVEVNSETDFVARNDKFQSFVKTVTQVALDKASGIDELLNAEFTGQGKPVSEALTDNIATIGENLNIRRMEKLCVNEGVVAGYVHNQVSEGLGKIAVLVALQSSGDQEKLSETGKKIAMHVAAAFPQFLNPSQVSEDVIEREKSVIREQALASGKPENIVEKMLEGRMKKFYEEICLTDQIFVIDGETRISSLIDNLAKELGTSVELTGYARLQLGEGIEKEESNFAEEVAAAVNG